MALRMQFLCSVLMVTLLGCAVRELPPSSPPPQTAVKVEESPSESFTTFLGMKHAIPAIRDSGGGSVINLSSVAALVGIADRAVYSAAKGALFRLPI